MIIITNNFNNDTRFDVLDILNSETLPFYNLPWGTVITMTFIFFIAPYFNFLGVRFLKDQPLIKQCIMNQLCRDGAKLQTVYISLWAIYVVGMKYIQAIENESLYLEITKYVSFANEAMFFTGILISSSVVPIAVSILWARATCYGAISGVVGGAAAGMSVWLTLASTFPGGLSGATFVRNTGEEIPMLFGNITAIGMGAVFTIVVTYITRWNMTPEIEEEEWEKTRDIDNPLSPWVAKYQGELNLDDVENFHDRPPLDIVIRKFRAAKITSYIAAVCFTILFVVICQ